MAKSSWHFIVTSIACQSLGVSPNDLLNDIKSFGLFFEDFAVRDLRIYSNLLDGVIKHYRDNAGIECDTINYLRDGKWCAIEIKLGGDELIELGVKHLNLLKKKLTKKAI